MAVDMTIFGPQSESELETYSLESLVFSVQIALQRAMNKQGVSSKELAERLGMSPARVSQIFSERGPNLTLRTIAKIQLALGADFEMISRDDLQTLKRSKRQTVERPEAPVRLIAVWKESSPQNANRRPVIAVAA